jgi:SAM-dependent methyltransferase
MAVRRPSVGAVVGPLAAAFFDSLHPRASDDEVAWYAHRIGDPATLALDAMCGAGRVLIPLLARGCKVHGADGSPSLIARCEDKLAAQSLATTLFRQDVGALNVPFRYGAAFIAGSAFDAIVDPAAATTALERIRAHLVAPATLIVACHVPSTTLQRLAAPLVEVRTAKLDDGSQIALRSEAVWTEGARTMRAQRRYSQRKGTRLVAEENEAVRATWYAPADILELARSAGFGNARTEALPFATGWDGETFALIATA